MDVGTLIRFVIALVFVLSLIGGLAWMVRRFGLSGRVVAGGGRGRIGVVEVTPLDTRRRLALIRRDGVEHLIVLSPTREIVIETGIISSEGRAEGRTSAHSVVQRGTTARDGSRP